MKKLIIASCMLAFSFLFINYALAQAVVAAPASGVMGWINAHGGFQAAVLLLVGSAMAALSAVRTILSNFDGVAPGAAIPAGLVGLTWVNKVCVVLGQIVDFIQGNVQH